MLQLDLYPGLPMCKLPNFVWGTDHMLKVGVLNFVHLLLSNSARLAGFHFSMWNAIIAQILHTPQPHQNICSTWYHSFVFLVLQMVSRYTNVHLFKCVKGFLSVKNDDSIWSQMTIGPNCPNWHNYKQISTLNLSQKTNTWAVLPVLKSQPAQQLLHNKAVWCKWIWIIRICQGWLVSLLLILG